MIAVVEFVRNGATFLTYEIPLESEDSIVGIPWSEGVEQAINEFRRHYPGAGLFDVSLRFDIRN
jgi:hypothetical protein